MSQTSDIEFLDYIESSAQRMADLSGENQELRTKVAELSGEKVILEKVASTSVFDEERVDKLITKLGKTHIVDPLQTTKVAAVIKDDPLQLLNLMEKLAESAADYSAGVGVPRELIGETNDPDGWGVLANQK